MEGSSSSYNVRCGISVNRIMRSILFIFIFQFHLLCAFSQNSDSIYCVNFIQKNGDGSHYCLMYPQKIVNDTILKGKPSSYDINAVFAVTINPFQVKYEKYFYVYVGLDKTTGKKAIIVDSNNNHDFSDDSVFVFNLNDYNIEAYSEQQEKIFPRFQVDVNYYNGFEYIPQKTSLRINPFDSYYNKEKYDSEDEYLLNFAILTDFHLEGNCIIGNKKVNIIETKCETNKLVPEDLNQYSCFYFYEEGKNANSINSYHIGDTTLICNKKIYIQGVKGKTLYLKDLGDFTDGSQVGTLLPDMYAYDLESNEKIHLNPLIKGKYVFIDFWGSWCVWCIKAMPELKQLYDKTKQREDVMIVGIALEHPEDLGKLKNIIKENDIEWLNVWSRFSEEKSITSAQGLLGVAVYPTYIIVDKDGRIVYNTYVDSKDLAIDFFDKLIGK